MSKVMISIRLDSEVLQWFRDRFPLGYQSEINKILKLYQEEKKSRDYFILGRAQQIFIEYYAQCFWHFNKQFTVTRENISLIQNGLRKYGGQKGYLLAEELNF